MTNEEFERTREFILQQQAQFAVDIQKLREAQAEDRYALAEIQRALAQTERAVTLTAEIVARIGETITRLAKATFEGFKDVNAKINALVDSQLRNDQNQSRTDEKISALADSQKQTDARMSVLAESQKQTDEKMRTLADSQKQLIEALRLLINRRFSEE